MKIEKENTGIFITTTIKSEGWKEFFDAIRESAAWTIFDELKHWEDVALHILSKNGVEKYPYDLPKTAAPEVKDSRALIFAIMGTREYIKRNDAQSAAMCAFRAGHIYTRMMIRPAETPAIKGREVLAYYSRMREAKKKKKAKEHEEIVTIYNRIVETYDPHELPKQKELINLTIEALQKKHRNRKYEYNTVKSVIYRSPHKTTK